MNLKTKQTISILLSVVSSIGVAGTAYLAIKDSEKAKKKKEELHKNNPTPSKKDIFISDLKSFTPTIGVGVATIASIIVSNLLSKKAEASLIAGASLIEQGWKKYRYKVKHVLGVDTHNDIIKNIAADDYKKLKNTTDDLEDRRTLYYVEPIGFFKAMPEDLAWAYGDMNQRLHTIDNDRKTASFCLLDDMLLDANAEILNKDIQVFDLNWGWSNEYLDEMAKPRWIHMTLTNVTPKQGKPYVYVDFDVKPVFDPSNGGALYIEEVSTDFDKENEVKMNDFIKTTYKKVSKKEKNNA